MLEAKTETMLAVLHKARETDSFTSLMDSLDHLDKMFGEGAVTHLGPDFPTSECMWAWHIQKNGSCIYNGGLLYRDGEWSLHS